MKFRTHSGGICLIMSLLSEGMWSQTYTGEFFWARSQYLHVLCTMYQSAVNQPDSQSSFRWLVNQLAVSQSVSPLACGQSVSQFVGVSVNQSLNQNIFQKLACQSISLQSVNQWAYQLAVSLSISQSACWSASQSIDSVKTYTKCQSVSANQLAVSQLANPSSKTVWARSII